MKVDQTVLPRKRHLGQTSELLRQQHSSYAKVHIGQQAHHILSVQRAQKQHMVTKTTSHLVGSKRSSPGRLPTFALISSLMCRVAIEKTCGRSAIVEKKRSPETWAAPVRRTEGSTKRVRCGLHTARRPESAQLPKRDEMAASRKYCRAALISEMRETRTAQHVCVRKIRTNGQTARLLT